MTDMHIDHRVLRDLQDVMEEGYLQLLETFLQDSEQRLSQLHGARTTTELSMAAHSFKGSSSNMGAIGLANLCQQLEERIKERTPCGIEELIHRIDQEYLVVQRFYRGERERVSAS
ncbi:Hpt domain-containing protein [Pseudomonas plecoglossicida]|uniref:Hpt domain-containing protein n=1 Tax=Pseudomonas plecoglossicida TaxID=70775 RepID=A0AAD0R1Q0_PSEDL|nr:Hpt domain-containing protein [Pseudomonas plecoglossicida]AXM98567.1 Hpt domain-containing protein [Pseudomonas plecoglossicida]QLB54710.1 Hpt domain-containing protein [Pseudomonas plecoglossicida]GLR34757.1 sensor histidine kinase [Pseudomonas plecoglossicida]